METVGIFLKTQTHDCVPTKTEDSTETDIVLPLGKHVLKSNTHVPRRAETIIQRPTKQWQIE